MAGFSEPGSDSITIDPNSQNQITNLPNSDQGAYQHACSFGCPRAFRREQEKNRHENIKHLMMRYLCTKSGCWHPYTRKDKAIDHIIAKHSSNDMIPIEVIGWGTDFFHFSRGDDNLDDHSRMRIAEKSFASKGSASQDSEEEVFYDAEEEVLYDETPIAPAPLYAADVPQRVTVYESPYASPIYGDPTPEYPPPEEDADNIGESNTSLPYRYRHK